MKNDKIRPNPSLNNHSGGSSIGKYESENYINKNKDKTENNEDENAKPKEESKFKKEQTLCMFSIQQPLATLFYGF